MSQREQRRSILWLIGISFVLAFGTYFYSFAFVRIETKALALALSAPATAVVMLAAAYVPSALGRPELTGLALVAQFVTYFVVVLLVRAGYRRLTGRSDS